MPRVFQSFLFKLILTVAISVFVGFQLAKIEIKEAEYGFQKILGTKAEEKIVVDSALQGRIETYLSEQKGDYSVYVKDLRPDGQRNICVRCEEGFEAASLYKVFLMAAVFQAISDGKLTMETGISAKMGHLREVYGGSDFGYEDFSDDEVIGYTVGEGLERVATVSDNYSAIMLAEKVGWGKVQDVADEIEAEQTSIKSPITTSTKDVGTLMEKLYKGEIVSLESSEQILDLLALSKMNNRIPAKLPEEVRVAHKTGELSGVRNDAGVVFFGANPYVIVLMSKNLKGEDDGVENLAEVSKIVYEYYSNGL